METIELTRLDGDRWRWAYLDGNGARILSNDVYTSRSEALASARAAYPDLDEAPNGDENEQPRKKGRSGLTKLLVLAVVALAAIAAGWLLASD